MSCIRHANIHNNENWQNKHFLLCFLSILNTIRMFDRTVHKVTEAIEGIFTGNINTHRVIPMNVQQILITNTFKFEIRFELFDGILFCIWIKVYTSRSVHTNLHRTHTPKQFAPIHSSTHWKPVTMSSTCRAQVLNDQHSILGNENVRTNIFCWFSRIGSIVP